MQLWLPWLKGRVEADGIIHVTITPQPLDAQMRHKTLYAASQSVGHSCDVVPQFTQWFHSVVVSTSDSESDNPGSSPGGTILYFVGIRIWIDFNITRVGC